MTTLPPNYLKLSPAWLEKNPLPEDAYRLKNIMPSGGWFESLLRGQMLPQWAVEEYTYATARTDLPREAYADSEPGAEVASERADEKCPYCGDDSVDCLACIEHDRRQANETIATLRAQLEAKEAECRELRESNAVLQSQVDNFDVNLEQVRLTQKGIWRTKVESAESRISELEAERDKLRAEVERWQKSFEGHVYVPNEEWGRLTAELDAVRKALFPDGLNYEPDMALSIRTRTELTAKCVADLKASQARCGELELALRDLDTALAVMFWTSDDGMIQKLGEPDDAPDEKLGKAWAEARALLTPSQQPDNFDSSGVEGHAGEQKCDDPTLLNPEPRTSGFQRAEMPSNAPCSVTEPSENQASPAVNSSRPEPVKAGEWLPIESAPRCVNPGPRDNGRRPVLVTRYPANGVPPVAVARLTQEGWMSGKRYNRLWFQPTHWQPLPAPPIAPEGKATEGEG